MLTDNPKAAPPRENNTSESDDIPLMVFKYNRVIDENTQLKLEKATLESRCAKLEAHNAKLIEVCKAYLNIVSYDWRARFIEAMAHEEGE